MQLPQMSHDPQGTFLDPPELENRYSFFIQLISYIVQHSIGGAHHILEGHSSTCFPREQDTNASSDQHPPIHRYQLDSPSAG